MAIDLVIFARRFCLVATVFCALFLTRHVALAAAGAAQLAAELGADEHSYWQQSALSIGWLVVAAVTWWAAAGEISAAFIVVGMVCTGGRVAYHVGRRGWIPWFVALVAVAAIFPRLNDDPPPLARPFAVAALIGTFSWNLGRRLHKAWDGAIAHVRMRWEVEELRGEMRELQAELAKRDDPEA